MTTQNITTKNTKLLNEILDNAIVLPVGSQDLLLMMAKAMRHTRDCMKQADQSYEPPNIGSSVMQIRRT